MTTTAGRAARAAGSLLLADISGYTSLLQGVAEAHHALIVEADEPPQAYALLSRILDAMVERVTPPFRLVKLEGDALFAVADDADLAMRGAAVVDCLRSCHAAFTAILAEAGTTWTCACSACVRIHDLGLKLILHHGEYVTQRIVGREELAGPDVILAHRLLKNNVRELVGARPYALMTQAAVDALALPVAGTLATSESYEGLPAVAVRVLPLD